MKKLQGKFSHSWFIKNFSSNIQQLDFTVHRGQGMDPYPDRVVQAECDKRRES